MAGFLKLDDAQDEAGRRLNEFGQGLIQPIRTVGEGFQTVGQGASTIGTGVQDITSRLNSFGQNLLQPIGQGLQPIQQMPDVTQDVTTRLQQFGQDAWTQLEQMNQPPLAPVRVGGDLHEYARQAANRYGIDPDIFERQIQQESGFRTDAMSPAGATGIAQFMPGTAAGMGVDPTDPYASLDAAARLMKSNLGSYGGDYAKALAAYNAGPGNVDKYGGVPPFEETQRYVSTILGGRTGTAGPVGPAAPVQSAASIVRGALPALSQFGDKELSSAEAYAACGPAAAARFAQLYGRNPTLREATDIARSVGWTQDQGMAGLGSESRLFDALGIAHRVVGADWRALAREASSGNPVTISTPGHYFTADSYNPQTGAFHVGSSGTDLRGGSEWMTPEQMEARMGALQGGLVADHPTVPAPSPLSQSATDGAATPGALRPAGARAGVEVVGDQTTRPLIQALDDAIESVAPSDHEQGRD